LTGEIDMADLKNTNYVVVVDFVEDQTLDECLLLGWNNKYDWFDCDTGGDEIMTKTGRVKKNKYGLIDIDRWVSVYVSDTDKWVLKWAHDGRKEGYDCTACRLEKRDDEWFVVSIEDDDDETDDE
jgi:hypothetical protein